MYLDHHVKNTVLVNAIDPTQIPKTPPPDTIQLAAAKPIDAMPVSQPVNTVIQPSRIAKEFLTADDLAHKKKKPDTVVFTRPAIAEAKKPEAKTIELNPSPVDGDEVAVADPPAPFTDEEKDTLSNRYGTAIGIEPGAITNFPLYRFIDKWMGVDYRIGGTDSNGIDCSGFSKRLYEEVYGLTLLRTAKEQHRYCKRVKKPKDASEGDLVFFHVLRFRISHVGVYLGNNYFVHASTSQGVIISNLNDPYWHKRFAGFGKLPVADTTAPPPPNDAGSQ